MSGFDITFGIEAGEVEEALDRLQSAFSNVSMVKFMRGAVQPHLHERATQRFESEGDSASGKWKPLTDYTNKDRQKQGFSAAHPINVRTGQLRDFITNQDGDISQTGIAGTMRLDMPGGTSDDELLSKLETAQLGRDPNPNPKFNPVPARPVMALDRLDLDFVMTELFVHVFSVVKTGNLASSP